MKGVESLLFRRRIAAWLLLSVFVPMLILALGHRHAAHTDKEPPCPLCEKHVPHLSTLHGEHTLAFTDCLLCSFLTLPVLFAACTLLSFLFLLQPKQKRLAFLGAIPLKRVSAFVSLRAPPCVVFQKTKNMCFSFFD
ncbi:MAG: hypothetical protein IKO20_08965 [Bacteroidaceae bacterium]|nr:hypothetical protein [Bacteroidaceae bacterium]